MNIEFKEGSVCFADGTQWDSDNYFSGIVNFEDFQLNTIKQGGYISKSELDTEDKYNRAVEVFGLLGLLRSATLSYGSVLDIGGIIVDDAITIFAETTTSPSIERKITFNQLMAIGELKRLMNERDSNHSTKPNSSVSKVNRGIDRNKKSTTLTTEEETELKSRAMASELDRQGEEWPKIGDEVLVCADSKRLIEIKGKKVKLIGKCTHSDGATILTVEHRGLGVFAVASGPWIKKPKSKEDLLIEELQAKLLDNNAVDTWMLAANIVNGDIEGLSYDSSEVVK